MVVGFVSVKKISRLVSVSLFKNTTQFETQQHRIEDCIPGYIYTNQRVALKHVKKSRWFKNNKEPVGFPFISFAQQKTIFVYDGSTKTSGTDQSVEEVAHSSDTYIFLTAANNQWMVYLPFSRNSYFLFALSGRCINRSCSRGKNILTQNSCTKMRDYILFTIRLMHKPRIL